MRWGIRTSLIVGLAGLLLAAGGIAAGVVMQLVGGEAEARVLEAQRRQAAAEGRMLEAACAAADDCDAALAAAVARLDGDDARRTLYGAGGRALVDGGAPDALALDVLQGAGAAWRRVEREGGAEHRVAVPLRLADGRRAAAVTAFDLDPLHAAVAERQRWVLAYLLFDFAAVLLFGIYVSGRVLVRPVQALTAAVERVGGDGAPDALPPPTGPRELVRLSAAFSAMLERLAARQRALEESLARLEATRDELVRSEKLATVGRLAAGVAHEVGNPLASVVGFVEFLRDPRGCPPDQQADVLARMDRELVRIRTTLRRLLDFSRPSPGRREAMDPRAVAEGAAALVRFQKAAADVRIAVHGAAPRVVADGEGLRQALVNLLMNAVEAGAGAVDVRLSTDGQAADGQAADGQAVIAVEDDGPGIPPELAERLFEPFATTRPAGEGTGLGLAISRRLVEEMGGGLTLASAPGEAGARFRLTLPLAPPDAPDGATGPGAPG